MVALASVGYIFRVFIEGAVTFIDKGSSAVGGRSFKIAKAGVVDDIKGVDRRNLRQRLITYKLKGPLLLINSLISISNHSIGSSL
jgi:hypothetical protein